jgi:hypothetical protein
MLAFDSDEVAAAVTAAVQAIAAYSDQEGLGLTPEQCETLAETVISHYLAFQAGITYATSHTHARTAADPGQ